VGAAVEAVLLGAAVHRGVALPLGEGPVDGVLVPMVTAKFPAGVVVMMVMAGVAVGVPARGPPHASTVRTWGQSVRFRRHLNARRV
jgi:hypothetical protein